jgi:hypothetical protein
MRRRRVLFTLLAPLVPGLGLSCGSRTGLLADFPNEGGAPEVTDAAVPPFDVSPPIAEDAGEEDAGEEEALPPLDVTPPPPINDCPDAASTFIYVITSQYSLMSFYPPTATFKPIGRIVCPAPSGDTPFSMAVDRSGIAYVAFAQGGLFRVSTATAACQATPFVPNQLGFGQFGMGFSRDAVGTGETLYVASDAPMGQLATIDTTTFALHVVGSFQPPITGSELTGTGAGDLFGFYSTSRTDSAIGQIDKTTARVVGEAMLPGVAQGNGWAFAFWGGDFYLFTAPTGSTVVTRYRPADGSIVRVAQSGQEIVGAGVSTCAPQQ